MGKFFIASMYGDSAFLGLRLKREGHKVRMFIQHPNCKLVYDGMLDKATSPMPNADEVVIVDSEGMGSYADKLRRRGQMVIGGSVWSDMIELDRAAGIGLMHKYGIRTPETKAFTNVAEAIRFLMKQQEEWFYKPSDNKDAAWTQGGYPDMLSRFMKLHPSSNFILQKKIKGIEISLEGWFNGRDFIYPFNSTVEDKRFLAGDLGPNVGCMGNIVWTYEEPQPRLALATLCRIVPALTRAGYVGPVDINCILDDDGNINGLEWTPRFGYDAIQALSLLTPSNFGEQLIEFAHKRLMSFSLRGEYSFTINVSIPPYPHADNALKQKDFPIDRKVCDYPESVLLRDIMLDSNKLPVIAGSSGIVGSFGMIGRDMHNLRSDVFELVKQFKIPSAQYRNDCCTRIHDVIPYLSDKMFDLPFMEPVKEPKPIAEYPSPDEFKEMIVKSNTQAPAGKPMNISLVQPPLDVNVAPKFE